LADRWLSRFYGRCDTSVASAEAGIATLSGLGVRRPALVPLGVDAETFSPERRDPQWRERIGARPGQCVGLYVGRLATEKNLDVALAALHRVRRTADVRLVLIGDGHLRSELAARARAEPAALSVLPYEPDRAALARAYASADFYLAPFPHETFGLSALEALASGLPVVGVRSGALATLLEKNPNAFPYEPGSADSCAAAVLRLVEAGPLDRQGARRFAVERFSWERTFTRLLEVYGELRPRKARLTPTSMTPSKALSLTPS
jgi:alpha-1,6-mannosyltransferase